MKRTSRATSTKNLESAEDLEAIRTARNAYMRAYRQKNEKPITEDQRAARNAYMREYRKAHRADEARRQREHWKRKSESSAEYKTMGIAAGIEYLATVPEYKTELITELITAFLTALFAAEDAEEDGNVFEYWKQKTVSDSLKQTLKARLQDVKKTNKE